ncbi:uncharacterized protein MKK02DRAFT_45410 [Dioszegia hungarica]|uniref:Uncharacterized protein n=1 Tax=Dioszegia hungarica TaxID=4972 RepID=A0AA38LV23_9TREE|nr:uncharacterized protein MKK02DRAFT_45410 [Dioszegia hungarica]KAI9636705.1 hypothetical protein MKK02DRAFT_45410 [Dioszegia hungarica]
MLPILSESAQWVLSPLTSRQTERDEDLQYDFAHDAWAVARRLVLLDRGLDYLASACQGLAVLPDTSTPSVDVGIVRSQLSRTLASDHPQVVVSAAITGFGETRPSDLDKIRINHNTIKLGAKAFRDGSLDIGPYGPEGKGSYNRHVLFAATILAHETVLRALCVMGDSERAPVVSAETLAWGWEVHIFGGKLVAEEMGENNLNSCTGSTFPGDIFYLALEDTKDHATIRSTKWFPTENVHRKPYWDTHLPILTEWRPDDESANTPERGLRLDRLAGPSLGRGDATRRDWACGVMAGDFS